MPIPAATVPDAIAVAAEVAREFGLVLSEPVPLRSTNNAVAWLRPLDVVAKVSVARDSRLHTELQVAQQLHSLGAAVVPPASDLPCTVHARGGLQMTFWRYFAQPPFTALPHDQVARALMQLHAALSRLTSSLKTKLPSYMGELTYVRSLLTDEPALPAFTAADRVLLLNTFDLLLARLEELVPTHKLVPIHGAPHSYNVLLVGGEPVFIDFETVCIGPVEWDLAHLDFQVEAAYPELIQSELLWLCRGMVSVKVATLCAADIDRGDMREHAEWHLAHVKDQVVPNLRRPTP
jgi:hypothetical protein